MYFVKEVGIYALSAGAVLVPVFALLGIFRYRSIRQTVRMFVFSLYLSVVFALVGVPNLAYLAYCSFSPNLNLVPFQDLAEDFRNASLNVALFVPLGILLPYLWRKFQFWGNTVLFALGLSLGIELLQMFSGRTSDVNDLITNTLGAVLGFLLAKLLLWRAVSFERASESRSEAFFLLAVSCLASFFLVPYLSSALELMLL